MKPKRSPNSRPSQLLPPIADNSDGGSTSGARSPSRSPNPPSSSPGLQPWSYYHRGCGESVVTTSNAEGGKKRSHVKHNRSNKSRTLPLAPFKEDGGVDTILGNAHMLESFVLENVSLADIERWHFKKISRIHEIGISYDVQSKPKHIPKIDKKQIFMELVKNIQGVFDEDCVVLKLARCINESIGVDAFRVYKLNYDPSGDVQCYVVDHVSQDSTKNPVCADPKDVTFVLEAAKRGSSWLLNRENAEHFPETPHLLFEIFNVQNGSEGKSVIYQPILTADGISAYVIEMWRVSSSFDKADLDASSNFLVWGSLVLHYCSLYMANNIQKTMSEFLLDVVRAIFEEMVSLDQLIKRILEYAQGLVSADRASLFLVDVRNCELVSTVFDLKFEPGQSMDLEKKEIRIPINRGIAGHVASSGETMNIPDAYADYRFNREIDEATGYKTVNILCMPIKVQGEVIGVVQMVNKRDKGSFRREDEIAFEIFSTFFGLALHHARLYDTIMRKEQKYRVALEVLSYHNTCRENEVQAIMSDKDQVTVDLNDYYLDPYQFNELEKCKAVITMLDDLFDISKFDIITVTRFVLTVRKNYRTVPYHNFDHGWAVAHAMYVILKHDIRQRFDYKMRLALFVACLCHDLDHRGYTNKYMSETASPLAAMYTTSTLEHHHFNITVTILQQDGHNIFSHMSSEEYKIILGYIRQCILATDLAAFFPNLAKMKELHDTKSGRAKFSWSIPSHRDLAMAISMTAADLSASAKPWEVQIKTVKVIFEEFYDQGDKEAAAGRTPIPMMDRNMPDEQPSSQVGFLSQICIPCYNMLYRILPKTKPMYIMALKNLHNWKSKAARILNKKNGEESEESEIEEVSEEILLNGEPDIVEEDEEDDTDVEIKTDATKQETKEYASKDKSKINHNASKVIFLEESKDLPPEHGDIKRNPGVNTRRSCRRD